MSAVGARVVNGRRVAQSSVRGRSRSRSRTSWLSVTMTSTFFFVLAAGCVCFVSTMVGQVTMEQSRKEASACRSRLIDAQRSVDDLQRRLAVLESDSSLQVYADVNQFVKVTEGATAGGISRVASR